MAEDIALDVEAFASAVGLDVKALLAALGGAQTRRIGDQFRGTGQSRVSSSKCVVSHTVNVYDGYVSPGPLWQPNGMYGIAEVNWNPETLAPYGSTFANYSKANNIGTSMDFTTIFEGQYAMVNVFKISGVTQDLRIWIDDEEVVDWYEGTRANGVLKHNPIISDTLNNSIGVVNLNFTRRGFYKIRVSGALLGGTNALLGCNVGGRFHKPDRQRVFGIISDSWYDTINNNTSLNAGHELAARMGWKAWNLAVGGSGFINPSASGAGNPRNYGSDAVFASLAKAPEMDFLLLNGSVNDLGYPEADVIAAMEAFFDKWRTVRPDTPIIWQGLEPQSYFENTATIAGVVAREQVQGAVALADENVIGLIRSAEENWLTGTGSTAAPNGTGNQDFLIGLDGIHLSPEGTIWNGVMVHQRIGSMDTWKVAA